MSIVHYKLEETIAVVQMDDGKVNALSDVMLTELGDALVRAERDGANAIVLVGRAGCFCAGFDLKTIMGSIESAKTLVRRGGELLLRVYESRLPVVVACTGHALAAGALLLLTADLRIGTRGAFRIGLNEVAIGIPLPGFAMGLARDRLATNELLGAALRAQVYAPDEAARVGFLDEVLGEGADLIARAKEEATKLGALPQQAFRSTKERLRRGTIEQVTSTIEDDLRAITFGR